ncbi:MAG: metalloregulator ArsR/SmtB family transcription factor [Parvibaculum sp.]|nr:metalloregulator ArsR/SmtB family transcription factor [Parvibaculum sp.]
MPDIRLDTTLIALADPTRRLVINALRKQPRRAGELVAMASISAPAMSRHLKILRQSGLIAEEDVENDARVRLYRLQPEAFADLQTWLDEVQSFWAGQLDAFKAHVEGKTVRPKGKRTKPKDQLK